MATRFSREPNGVPRTGVPTGETGEMALARGDPGGVVYSSGSTSSSSSSIVRGRRTMELHASSSSGRVG